MPTKITLGGKEYEIHFGMLELDKIEEYHGTSIGKVFGGGNFGVRTTITALWAGITRFQPEFAPIKKREEVALMVDTFQKENGNIKAIDDALAKALNESGLMGNEPGKA